VIGWHASFNHSSVCTFIVEFFICLSIFWLSPFSRFMVGDIRVFVIPHYLLCCIAFLYFNTTYPLLSMLPVVMCVQKRM